MTKENVKEKVGDILLAAAAEISKRLPPLNYKESVDLAIILNGTRKRINESIDKIDE